MIYGWKFNFAVDYICLRVGKRFFSRVNFELVNGINEVVFLKVFFFWALSLDLVENMVKYMFELSLHLGD